MLAPFIVDILIVVAALIALFAGWRQGAVSSILSAIGIIAGLIIGLAVAPAVMGVTDTVALRFLLGLGVIVILAALGNLIGSLLGSSMRSRMRVRAFQTVDSAIGSAFQVLAVLLVSWLIAIPLAAGLGAGATNAIRSSSILSTIDRVIPESWSTLPTRISSMLNESGLPPLVDPFGSSVTTEVEPPRIEVANKALIEELRPSVVHVMGNAAECSRRLMGSGFVSAPDYVVTNAHVVAGTDSVRLDTMLGVVDATVVHYDPDLDIAVLHAPGLGLEPLPWAPEPAQSGDNAVVMGYPGSGPFEAAPARVSDRITIAGPDIYAENGVERDAYTVRGTIREGNSGGPMINESGEVLGVVFGASVDESSTGYAITAPQVLSSVDDITQLTQPVDTQQCVGA